LKDFENCKNTLQKYANLNLNWSFRKQAIVLGRTNIIVIPLSLVLSPVLVPLCKLNEFKKINIIESGINQINQLIPYGLKQKEALVRQSQDKAAEFAKEIEEIVSQDIFQRIFGKKEQKLLEKLSEYFSVLLNNTIKV
jgi:hypothetical protein